MHHQRVRRLVEAQMQEHRLRRVSHRLGSEEAAFVKRCGHTLVRGGARPAVQTQSSKHYTINQLTTKPVNNNN